MGKSLTVSLLSVFIFFAFSISFQEPTEEIIPREKRTSERGIYITAYVARLPRRFNYLKNQAKKAGLNTLVIDAKLILSRPLIKLIKERRLDHKTKVKPDPWLSRLTNELQAEGFIVSVRLVVFKDDHLILARPDLAVRNRRSGGLYRDNRGGRWGDPYSREVRLYNELVAEIAALSGVDEVQFDYIRFPAEAEAHNAYFPFAKKEISRVEVINSFLKAVRKRLKKYNTSIAVDIFGITAWQSRNDIENLGQDLKEMAKYVDVFSPMFYPSHFHRGYDGFANPGSHPYYFVNTGVRKAKEILSDEAVAIVPWIQGFNLRSPNFGPSYILEQIRAGEDEGIESYLVWNARNDYGAAFSALKKK